MASSRNKFGKNKVFPKCTLTRQPDHLVNIQSFTSSFQQFPSAVLIITDKSYSTFRPNPVYIYLLVPLVIKLPAPLIANTGSWHWQGNCSLRWSLQAPPTPTENCKFHPLDILLFAARAFALKCVAVGAGTIRVCSWESWCTLSWKKSHPEQLDTSWGVWSLMYDEERKVNINDAPALTERELPAHK